MPGRTRRSAEDRAEARRRSRYAARGVEPEEDTPDQEAAPGAPRPAGGSFLTRLFPPAPPLPGRPDPLAGFTYAGPARGLVAGIYLLGRSPTAWIATGAVWGVGRLLTVGSLVGVLASLVSFGALILAGWLGWQRPWLFGLMAAIVGILMYGGILAALLFGQPDAPSTGRILLGALLSETVSFQPLFGVVAGWYGGYLRRRMAATSSAGGRASPRRRS